MKKMILFFLLLNINVYATIENDEIKSGSDIFASDMNHMFSKVETALINNVDLTNTTFMDYVGGQDEISRSGSKGILTQLYTITKTSDGSLFYPNGDELNLYLGFEDQNGIAISVDPLDPTGINTPASGNNINSGELNSLFAKVISDIQNYSNTVVNDNGYEFNGYGDNAKYELIMNNIVSDTNGNPVLVDLNFVDGSFQPATLSGTTGSWVYFYAPQSQCRVGVNGGASSRQIIKRVDGVPVNSISEECDAINQRILTALQTSVNTCTDYNIEQTCSADSASLGGCSWNGITCEDTPTQNSASIEFFDPIQDATFLVTSNPSTIGVIGFNIDADGYNVHRGANCSDSNNIIETVTSISPFSNIPVSTLDPSPNGITEVFSVEAYKDGASSTCYSNATVTFDTVAPVVTFNIPAITATKTFTVSGSCDYNEYNLMVSNVNTSGFTIALRNYPAGGGGTAIAPYLLVNNGGSLEMRNTQYPTQSGFLDNPLSNYFTIDNGAQTCSYSFDLHLLTDDNTLTGNLIDTYVFIEFRDATNNINNASSIHSPIVLYDENYIPITSSTCTASDAQTNGYSTQNIEMVTGIKSNPSDTSKCAVKCLDGYVLKEDKTCDIAADLTNPIFNQVRMGSIYNYSKGTNTMKIRTGSETDFLSQMNSSKISVTYDPQTVSNVHPLFKQAYNYDELNGSPYDYPWCSFGTPEFNDLVCDTPDFRRDYVSFSYTENNGNSNMNRFFKISGVSASEITGIHDYRGMMYKGDRCFIVGLVDQTLATGGDTYQYAAVSVFDYGSVVQDISTVEKLASDQLFSRDYCLEIRYLFDSELSKYYESYTGKIDDNDNITDINNSWAIRLDLRIDANGMAYGGSALSPRPRFVDFKDMLSELSLNSHVIDPNPNYAALGAHYLQFKDGMLINGVKQLGLIGIRKDLNDNSCWIMFRSDNNGGESVDQKMILKDGSDYTKCGTNTLQEMRDVMGLTDSDVTLETYNDTGTNEEYYYFNEFVAVTSATNPFNTYKTQVSDKFNMKDGNMTSFPEFQLYQPGVSEDPSEGASGATFTGLGDSYTMDGYVTLAKTTDGTLFNAEMYRGFFIVRYLTASEGGAFPNQNYITRFLPVNEDQSQYLANRSESDPNFGSFGGPVSGGFVEATEVWQLIADFNHSLKILKGVVTEGSTYPTGIASQDDLDTYLSLEGSNAQVIKKGQFNGAGVREIFYSIAAPAP